MIDQIALHWARQLFRIARLDDKKVMTKLGFGIEITLVTLTIVILTILTGWASGLLVEQLLALFHVALLRYFTGGFHFRTNSQCIVFTILLANLISWLPATHSIYYLILNIVSMLFVIGLAPSGRLKQKLVPSRHIAYKIISICLISLSLILGTKIMTYSYLFQCMSMIRMKGGSGDGH